MSGIKCFISSSHSRSGSHHQQQHRYTINCQHNTFHRLQKQSFPRITLSLHYKKLSPTPKLSFKNNTLQLSSHSRKEYTELLFCLVNFNCLLLMYLTEMKINSSIYFLNTSLFVVLFVVISHHSISVCGRIYHCNTFWIYEFTRILLKFRIWLYSNY